MLYLVSNDGGVYGLAHLARPDMLCYYTLELVDATHTLALAHTHDPSVDCEVASGMYTEYEGAT